MKKMKQFIPILSMISISLISCSKQEMKSPVDERIHRANAPIISSDGSTVSLLQGYHNMGYSFTETCLDNDNFSYPKNIENSIVNFEDNLKENDFRKKLNIGGSVSVPTSAIDISLGINYSKEASISKLSRSTTYFAYIRFGESKVGGGNNNQLALRKSVQSYFDGAGNLSDPSNFIKKCGDEAVTSQVLSSKLMITLKLSFDTQKALNEFSTKIGTVLSAFVTNGVQIGPTVNLSYLTEETRKQIKLDLYGVQLGGQPEEMIHLLSLQNSCRLDKIDECQNIFEKLNKYISEDYKKQLNESDMSTWSIESSKTTPYDQLSVVDSLGKPLRFHWTSNYADSVLLSKLKTQVSQEISRQVDNYSIAKAMLESQDLAADEKKELIEISDKSLQNANLLKNLSSECYKSVSDCVNSRDMEYSKLITTYDNSLLKPNMGKLVSKIRSSGSPLTGQKYRSSEDFLNLKSVIDSGKFSSIYFKLKRIDNTLIRGDNVRFDIKCNKPWNKGYDPILFSGIYPNYEVLIDTVENNYNIYCLGKEMSYVADPKNVSVPDFIVEVWGRE
jgi:hypothetical protein